MTSTPEPFEVHPSGKYLHGTKADLAVGDLLIPGHRSLADLKRRGLDVIID